MNCADPAACPAGPDSRQSNSFFRSCVIPALVVLLLAAAVHAESRSTSKPAQPTSPFVCGTTPWRTAEALALNIYQLRKFGLPASTGVLPVSSDQGSVSVIEDDGTLITRPNRFDLAGTSLAFSPLGNGYTVAPVLSTFDSGTSAATPITLNDDDSVVIQLPFPFSFFGRSYTSVFLNTDGNLTFDNADNASTYRTLQRIAAGPPRIAPFFNDLYPFGSAARITVEMGADRALFTWTNVGEWTSNGPSGQNTFQAILEASGVIRFNYRLISASEGVVGIAPGATANPSIDLVDLSAQAGSSTVHSGIVGEVFALSQDINLPAVAQYFYRSHQDAYDGLIVFADFFLLLDNATAFAVPLRNNVQGIMNTTNQPIYDYGAEYGSAASLQVMVNMGMLGQYPFDPIATGALRTNSTVSILGQEFGHRWLSFIDTRDHTLLGRDDAHWSFFNNTLGSVMEGNEILDLGNNRFRTIGATYRYSPMDQYVMGLRSAAEVPPWFVVANPQISAFPPDFPFSCRGDLRTCPPYIGLDFSGVRREVTVDQLISDVGPRVPSSAQSQKNFRVAFILLTQMGQSPQPGSLAKVDSIRSAWEGFFATAVEGRATMRTDLLYPPPPRVTEVSSTIAANGSRSIETAGTDASVRVGYAGVDSGYGVAVFRSRDSAGIKSEAAVPAATADTSFLIFAEKTANTATGLAMVNISNSTATVSVRLSNGLQSTIQLAGGEQQSRFINELFPNLAAPFSGTASITSNSPIALTAIRGTTNELSEFIMASVPISAGATPGNEITVFPQVADGAGYSTELVLINPAAARITGQLQFSSGTKVAYDIPPTGMWRFQTPGSASQVSVGYATIIPDAGNTRPVASAIFALRSGGVLRFQAGVPAQTAVTRALIFGSRDSSKRTVMAIANPAAQDATVRLIAYDANGIALVSGKTLTIPANGHVAAFIDENQFLPELPQGFQGTVLLESSIPVHVVTLRSLITSANSFIMTTMPIVDLNSGAPPSSKVYFPQLADGGNFSTELLLLSAGNGSFRLQFFGTDGQPLPVVVK